MDGIPLHLENILKHFEGTTLSQAELIFLIAYAVSLESGFVSQEGYEESERYLIRPSPTASYHSKNVLRLSRIPPKYVKMEDSIRFSLKLYTFVDLKETSPDEIYSLLVGFVSGDFLILSLSPANTTGARGYSIALSIGRYVLATHRKDKPLFQRFRKLDELSLFLRDSLFTPMRNQHLRSLEAYMYPSLEGIPPEMYDNILKYLNRNQLRILLNVNKTLYNLTACSKHMLKYL
ncbi:nutcracker [Haematobia irritans]|uniref:nutcracker n=1 Tax=Haematobia irritans TaxID=7368 RepID=UPI003F50BD11